jgi:hypothetical protein
MKRTMIYLDTSVIGGCFDPEFAQWSTGLLNDLHQGIYQVEIPAYRTDYIQ